MRLALYQPDIPPNVGTLLRLGACTGVAVDIIEPCGFPFSEKSLRRAGMDYVDHVVLTRHASWDAFLQQISPGTRLILLTTQSSTPYTSFAFQKNDILVLGRESSGVPDDVHSRADYSVTVPMAGDLRSLNVAIAGAMVLGEALRQTEHFPSLPGAV